MAPPPVPKAPQSDWQKYGGWAVVFVNLLLAFILETIRDGATIQASIGVAICFALLALFNQNERLHGQE